MEYRRVRRLTRAPRRTTSEHSAWKKAGLQSQSATIQNQIFQEQFNIEKANMLKQRRNVFRQGQVRSAEAKVAASSTGQFRSSTYGAVQSKIAERTSENVASIDTALAAGERISTLNQQQADLQSQIASTQAKGSFLSAFF